MMAAFYCSAIALMVIGHVFKVKRWKLYISVYEDASERNLMEALALGHMLNALLPARIGDLIRVVWSGKKLKNGYSLALATVFADLYVDLITVGFMFFGLAIIKKGGDSLQSVARIYLVIFLILVPLTVLCVVFRKAIKKGIAAVVGLFNDRIQLRLLYLSFLCIASLKDIVSKISKTRFAAFTVAMWASYTASYALFAEAIQRFGYFYATSNVFEILFTGASLYRVESGARLFWGAYLVIPLLICWCVGALFFRRDFAKNPVSRPILPQLNAADRLAFLKTYYEEDQRGYVQTYLEVNRDVTVLEDRSAGSDASTVLAMKMDGALVYRKYAFSEAGAKLERQIRWIEAHQSMIPLPIIAEKRIEPYFSSYDMPCYQSAVGMFRMIHTTVVDESWTVLKSALEIARANLHSVNVRQNDPEMLKRYIHDKVRKNLHIVETGRGIQELEQYDAITVNGRALPTLKSYRDMLEEAHLQAVFRQDPCSEIHGDLTIENIICLKDPDELSEDDFAGKVKPGRFFFIDPNPGNLHESPYLDYAKLLQSLHGNYEFLMTVQKVDIQGSSVNYMMAGSSAYSALYRRYHAYLLETFSEEQVISIYYHEIVHWLRLLPYKIRKGQKIGILFYTGLLTVLDDVRRMENERKNQSGHL